MIADKLYDVQMDTLVYGGEALGRLPDGRAVFVPFTLPGELVRLRLLEEKRSHARGELVEILRPVPERIAARCPHFGACGGCHYQHLPYSRQLQAKQAILIDQLERIGKIPSPNVEATVASPQEWNYRNTVQFHLTSEGKLGYLAMDSHRVVPIRECHLPETALNDLWPRLDLEPVPGVERITLRLGLGQGFGQDLGQDLDEDLLMVMEGSDPQAPEFSVDIPLSAIYVGPGGPVVMAGDDHLVIQVAGRLFRVSARSFFQVNTLQAGAMVERLLAGIDLPGEATVLDVYCGVGLFSAFLASKASRLVGIEMNEAACQDFAGNLDEFNNVELYQGSAEEVLPGLSFKPDLVVVDPPRAGIEREALAALLALRPRQLVYISCDPATLARDARRICDAGYRLARSVPFDLFPQTYHIESMNFFY
jgi:23S rRNA (uracil1939-C5)-methyltransferase